MKPLNFLTVILPALALAFVACPTSTNSTTGGTTGTTIAGNNGGNNNGGTSSGGNNGGGTSSGGNNGGGTSSGGAAGGTSGGGLGLGASCTPPTNAMPKDACAASGFQCTINAAGTAASCQLPTEYATCITVTPGCASPFTCINGDSIFGTGTGDICVQNCTTTPPCVNAAETCQSANQAGTVKICSWNFCGPNQPAMTPPNGSSYYAPCNSETANDGTCVPTSIFTGIPITGVCWQNGTAPAAGPCDFSRDDGGLATQCAQGTFCVNGASGKSICAPNCGAIGYPGEFDGGVVTPADGGVDGGADAGPAFTGTCATGSTCVDITGGFIDLGTCLATCVTGGTNTCTSPLTCQAAAASGTAGFCGP